MNKNQAKTLLRHFAPGCIKLSKHCRKRMLERNVTMDDILYVLMWGDVIEIKENIECQNWECKVKGTDTDGNELFFLAALNEHERSVLCITVY